MNVAVRGLLWNFIFYHVTITVTLNIPDAGAFNTVPCAVVTVNHKIIFF